jgi:hypothetical protein
MIQIPAPNASENIILKESKIQCPNCPKTFVKSNGLHKHLNGKCKGVGIIDKQLDEINKQIIELQEKNKKLENELKKVNKVKKQTKITIIKNNPIIIMVPYGKEDTYKCLDLLLSIACSKGMNAIPELIKWMHFNKNYPEWNNIYIPYKKNTDLMIYTDKWETKTINEMVNKIYADKKKCIIDNKDLFYDYLIPEEQVLYNEWIDKTMALETNISNDAQKYVNEICRTIKNTLFDNKQLTLDTRKKVNQQNKNSGN